jgi:hypothetical protein
LGRVERVGLLFEWVEASVVALHGRLDIVEGKAGSGAAGP